MTDVGIRGIDQVLERLQQVRRAPGGWAAHCPAHEDSRPSLSVRVGVDGRVLLHCFAGCAVDAICAAVGWSLRDLFPSGGAPRDRRPPPPPAFTSSPTRSSLAGERSYPPGTFRPQDALAVWNTTCARAMDDDAVDEDRHTYGFVAQRGLLEAWELRLFGVLAWSASVPRSLGYWYGNGYRLIAPLYDEHGDIANVQARCIGENPVKTRFPKGSHAKGFVFADARGLAILQGRDGSRRAVIYGEGLTDMLALGIASPIPVLTAPGAENVVSGIGPWITGRDLYLAVDNDPAGDKVLYAASQAAFALGANRVVRVVWPAGCKDACDALVNLGSQALTRRLQHLVEKWSGAHGLAA